MCPALQITLDSSHLADSVCYADVQVDKTDTSDSTVRNKPPVWPTVRVLLKTVVCVYGYVTYSVMYLQLKGQDTQTDCY